MPFLELGVVLLRIHEKLTILVEEKTLRCQWSIEMIVPRKQKKRKMKLCCILFSVQAESSNGFD